MRRVGNLIVTLTGPNLRPHGPLALAGAALVLVAGLIHLFLTPEHFEESRYLGWLFLADFAGSVVAAFGIYRGARWGWALGVLVAGGAFVLYFLARMIGLFGMEGESLFEPLSVLCKVLETLFLALCAFEFTKSLGRYRQSALVGIIVAALVVVPGVAMALDPNGGATSSTSPTSSTSQESTNAKGAQEAGHGKKMPGFPVRWTATSPAIHLGDQYTLDVTNTSQEDQKLHVGTMIMDHRAKKNMMVVDESLELAPGEEKELTATNDYGDANHFQTTIGSQTKDTKDLGLEVKVTDPEGNETARFNQEAFLILQNQKAGGKTKSGKAGSKAKGDKAGSKAKGKTTPAQ